MFKWYKIILLSSNLKSTLFLFLPLPRPIRCFFAYFFLLLPETVMPASLAWAGLGWVHHSLSGLLICGARTSSCNHWSMRAKYSGSTLSLLAPTSGHLNWRLSLGGRRWPVQCRDWLGWRTGWRRWGGVLEWEGLDKKKNWLALAE